MAQAREESPLFRREAEKLRGLAVGLREQARALRGAGHESQVSALQEQSAAAERVAGEASAKAQAIEDAAHDLKAINPRQATTSDQRTRLELLEAIEAKGREVDEATAGLKRLLAPGRLCHGRADRTGGTHKLAMAN